MTRSSGGHRAIDWDALTEDVRSLPPTARTVLGETWKERMRQEHLAVGAFALLTQELAQQGCDATVLGLVARASADEVRHAQVCGRMAVAMLGHEAVPRVWRGLPKVPAHATVNAKTRVLLHVVEMCCLSETLTAVFFAEMVSRATHSAARAVVESLLEDEIDHSRVGWAYLATQKHHSTDWRRPCRRCSIGHSAKRFAAWGVSRTAIRWRPLDMCAAKHAPQSSGAPFATSSYQALRCSGWTCRTGGRRLKRC
jgi:hypothetical protein